MFRLFYKTLANDWLGQSQQLTVSQKFFAQKFHKSKSLLTYSPELERMGEK